MLAQLKHLAANLVNHQRLVFCSSALQNVLNHIVAVLVLHKLTSASVQLVQQRALNAAVNILPHTGLHVGGFMLTILTVWSSVQCSNMR